MSDYSNLHGVRSEIIRMAREAWEARGHALVVNMARAIVEIGEEKAPLLVDLLRGRPMLTVNEAHLLYRLHAGNSSSFRPHRPISSFPRALFAYAKKAFHFSREPGEVLVLDAPLSGPGAFDVDQVAVWLAAHLMAVGINASFVLVKCNGRPEWHHVFVRAILDDGPVALDPHHCQECGEEVSVAGQKMELPIERFLELTPKG